MATYLVLLGLASLFQLFAIYYQFKVLKFHREQHQMLAEKVWDESYARSLARELS